MFSCKMLPKNLFKSLPHSKTKLYHFSTAAKKACLYKTLNVSTDVSPEEIRKSYLELAKMYHPDTSTGEVPQEEKFKEVAEAYRVLSDPRRREQYDIENGILSSTFAGSQRIDPKFENEEAYKEWASKKKESERNNEEELSAYFQNKYFKNKDYFKKKTSGDNPFDLTRKLYNQNIDQKVKMQEDYVMFHEFTYKAYYEHKDDVKFGEDRHIVFKLIYDFRYLILTSILGATVYGIYSGFSRDDKDKEDTGNIKYFNDGKGLLTKALPINVV